MKDRDVRRLERIERVETFLDDHISDFAPGGVVALTLTDIKGIIAALHKARAGQVRTPLTKDEIIQTLYARFKAISRTSRSIRVNNPDFPAGDYRYPDEYSENAATTHADYLLSLLEDAPADTPAQLAEKAARRDLFIAHEMDAAFVGTLRGIRDSLDAANAGKYSDNQEGLEATASIGTLLNRANDAVTALHGPIHNKYEFNPDKIHAWKRASRIESDPAPPEPEPEPPTP